MKKIVFIALLALPYVSMAATLPLLSTKAPEHIRPESQSFYTTEYIPKMDWTDVFNPSGVSYIYQASRWPDLKKNGYFDLPFYTSAPLSTSEIKVSLPAGKYYWHVKAVAKNGLETAWSKAWIVNIVDPILTTGTKSPKVLMECLNGGWTTFNNPVFKEVEQCVRFVGNLYKFTVQTAPSTSNIGESVQNLPAVPEKPKEEPKKETISIGGSMQPQPAAPVETKKDEIPLQGNVQSQPEVIEPKKEEPKKLPLLINNLRPQPLVPLLSKPIAE